MFRARGNQQGPQGPAVALGNAKSGSSRRSAEKVNVLSILLVLVVGTLVTMTVKPQIFFTQQADTVQSGAAAAEKKTLTTKEESKVGASGWHFNTPLPSGPLPPSYFPNLCAKGKAPWEGIPEDELLDSFLEMMKVWEQRPGRSTNDGGGGIFHYFALWTMIRILKPPVVIESGAHKGVGTFFLRQAAGPDARIIVISPEAPALYQDKGKATYLTVDKFVDFAKITRERWVELMDGDESNIANALLFVDDHQAGITRTTQARQVGFRHLAFDDNYLPGPSSDNTSLKHVCAGWSIWEYLGITTPEYRTNFNKVVETISRTKYDEHVQAAYHNVNVYAEFPPVYEGPTRFNIGGHDRYLPLRQKPLFDKSILQAKGIDEKVLGSSWDDEAKKYTFIPYVQLAPMAA